MRIFGYEPAVIVYVANAVVAALVAYGLDLSQEQVAAVATIATAIVAVIVAVMTRPLVVSTLTGAVATILAAMAAFGLDLTAEQIGTAVTLGSIALALLLRQNVSPVPAVKAPVP